MPDVSPVEIRRVEDRELHVSWDDGHRSVFPNKMLRERCPCAGCVHELTGQRLLDPGSVRADIRAEEISLVGRYAIRSAGATATRPGSTRSRSSGSGAPARPAGQALTSMQFAAAPGVCMEVKA